MENVPKNRIEMVHWFKEILYDCKFTRGLNEEYVYANVIRSCDEMIRQVEGDTKNFADEIENTIDKMNLDGRHIRKNLMGEGKECEHFFIYNSANTLACNKCGREFVTHVLSKIKALEEQVKANSVLLAKHSCRLAALEEVK